MSWSGSSATPRPHPAPRHPPAKDVGDLGLPVALSLPPFTLQTPFALQLQLQLFCQLGPQRTVGSVPRDLAGLAIYQVSDPCQSPHRSPTTLSPMSVHASPVLQCVQQLGPWNSSLTLLAVCPFLVPSAHPFLLPAQSLVFLLELAQSLLFPNTDPGEKAKETELTPSPARPCPLLAAPAMCSPLAAGILQLLPQSRHLLPQLGLLRLTLR